MNLEPLRKWLMVIPRPASVKMQVGDKVHELTIPKGQTWKNVASSVDTMGPESIELYSADGKLLRAAKSDQFEGEQVDEPEGIESRHAGKVTDAESQRFIVVAELLADAHKFTEVAFDKLVAILDALNRKQESTERTLATTERLLQQKMQEDLEAIAEREPDLLREMIGAFISGKGGIPGAAARAAAAPTNGKAKA